MGSDLIAFIIWFTDRGFRGANLSFFFPVWVSNSTVYWIAEGGPMGIKQVLKRFDAFPRAEDHLLQKTQSGALGNCSALRLIRRLCSQLRCLAAFEVIFGWNSVNVCREQPFFALSWCWSSRFLPALSVLDQGESVFLCPDMYVASAFAVSIVGLAIMATLFLHELRYYLTTYTVHQVPLNCRIQTEECFYICLKSKSVKQCCLGSCSCFN